MGEKEEMNMEKKLKAINILDLIEQIGEDELNSGLSDFSCPFNKDIERFIKNNALNFARQKISMTYLVLTKQGDIAGFFTLAHKPLAVKRASVEHFSNGPRDDSQSILNTTRNPRAMSCLLS